MNYNDIELDYLNKLDIAFENNDKKKIIQLLYELSQMPCDIVGFSYVHKYLEIFSDEEIISTPLLSPLSVVDATIYFKFDRAERYAKVLTEFPFIKAHTDYFMPHIKPSQFRRSMKKLIEMRSNQKINLPVSLNGLSILNGFIDFTAYNNCLVRLKEPIKLLYGDKSLGVFEAAMAEMWYQRDECYNALATIVGIIPRIENTQNAPALFTALFIQLEIMIVTGQLSSVEPVLENIYKKLIHSNSYWIMPNFYALKAWASMYDDNTKEAENWVRTKAPDELDTIRKTDIFRYIIKARVYILQKKYYSLINMRELLRPLLVECGHIMDLCQLDILCAIGYFEDNQHKKAFELLHEVLKICKKRRFDRLLADEGIKIYTLIMAYKIEEHIQDEYVEHIISLSKKIALLYPKYMHRRIEEIPALTPSENDVIKLMCDGKSNADIADFLGISLSTVKFYVSNIFIKLNAKNRHEAIKIAAELGII